LSQVRDELWFPFRKRYAMQDKPGSPADEDTGRVVGLIVALVDNLARFH